MKILLIILAATAASGQSVYTGTWSSTGAATWGATAASGSVCGPPSYSCSRSDIVINPLSDTTNSNAKHPPLLAAPGQSASCGGSQCWGGSRGAGVVANDPFYNSNRMLRVTDYATDVAGDSFFTRSSAETIQTNYDGTVFGTLEGPASHCLFSLNRVAWASPSCGAGSSSCQAATKQACGQGPTTIPTAFVFGTTALDNLAMYAFNNNSQRIERWILTESTPWTVALDPNWPSTGANGINVAASTCLGTMFTPWTQFGNFAVSGDGTRFTAEIRTFGGAQDEGGLIVVWDKSKGCKWFDVRRMAMATDWNNPVAVAADPTGDYKLGAPAAPTAVGSAGGNLIGGHQYAVQYSYTLRNGTTQALTAGDVGETNGSPSTMVALTSGQGSIALSAPGAPPTTAQPVGATILPTGYNVYMCDNTASPGCVPSRQTVDQAPLPVSGLVCTAATGNTGTTYSYTYYVAVRNSPALNFASGDLLCTVNTANAISTTNPNSISWTASSSTNVVNELFRNSRDGRIYRGTGTSFTDDGSVGPSSIVPEAVQGVSVNTTISNFAVGGTFAYTGLQATSGFSTHNDKMDASGNPVVITSTAIANNLGFHIAPHFWYPDGSAVCNPTYQACPYNVYKSIWCPQACTGHRVEGYQTELRQPGNSSSLDYEFASPPETTNITKADDDSGCSSSNPKCQFASHESWGNAQPGLPYNFPIVSTYTPVTAYGTASWPTTLYTSELMGLPMSSTLKPVRFGMLYSNGNEVTRFYSTPRCAVAQTGDYAICSTDWTYWNSNADGSPGFGGFGDTNGNETCDPSLNPNGSGTAACRVDVVLYELR